MKMLKKFAIVLLLSGSCGISAMDEVEVVCCETPVEVHPYLIVSSETLFDPATGARLTFMGEPLGSVSNIESYGDILTDSIADTQALILKEELLTQAALNALEDSLKQPVRPYKEIIADIRAKVMQREADRDKAEEAATMRSTKNASMSAKQLKERFKKERLQKVTDDINARRRARDGK
jgi:hypothetical protein